MYADPANIRKHAIKLSLNDRESELLDSLAIELGVQKATLVRDLIVERAIEILAAEHERNRADAPVRLQRAA